MNRINCPSWFFNQWCVPHDYVYALAYLALILPYLIVWIKIYKKYGNQITSVVDYCKLILMTEVSIFIYNLVFSFIGIAASGKASYWGNFLLAVSYGSQAIIIFALLLTLILILIYMLFRKLMNFTRR